MRIEAFSEGKSFARPQDCEDAFLVLPGMGYAVIDGVTDRAGRPFGALRGGRFAAGLVQRALADGLAAEDLSVEGGHARIARLLTLIEARLRAGYAEHGRLEDARASAAARAGATLALVFHDGDMLRMAAIGDSGVRVTLTDDVFLHLDSKPLDRITSLMRREAWALLTARGVAGSEREAIASTVVGRGLAVAPEGMTDAETAEIAARVGASIARELPNLDAQEAAVILAGGVSAQRSFANRDADGLSYGVIDGFCAPPRHVAGAAWPRASVRRIELFTDGYFDVPAGFGLAVWERRFREVEALDPHKIGDFASMKGSGPQNWSDDRTYLCVDFVNEAGGAQA